MPDLNTVRASAPAGVVLVKTIEFHHASFAAPIRITSQPPTFSATLEATAPVNASEEVAFDYAKFELVLPKSGDQGQSTIDIQMSNVDRVVSAFLEVVISNPGPVTLIYREYFSTDTAGPAEDPPLRLSLVGAEADNETHMIQLHAKNADNLFQRFPHKVYNIYDHPGLSR